MEDLFVLLVGGAIAFVVAIGAIRSRRAAGVDLNARARIGQMSWGGFYKSVRRFLGEYDGVALRFSAKSIGVVLGFVSLCFLITLPQRIEQNKLANLAMALKPTIDGFRPKCVVPADTVGVRLSRPYAFFYVDDYQSFDNSQAKLGVSDIKTLILMRSEVTGQSEYQDAAGRTRTAYSRQYDLWAFDMATGHLGAYTRLETALPPTVNSDKWMSLEDAGWYEWADSITEAKRH